jgi:hypothetical protein
MFIKVDVPRRLVKHLVWRRLLPDAKPRSSCGTYRSLWECGGCQHASIRNRVDVFSYSQLWQRPQPVWYLLDSNATIAGDPGITPRTVGVSMCSQLRCPVSAFNGGELYVGAAPRPTIYACSSTSLYALLPTSVEAWPLAPAVRHEVEMCNPVVHYADPVQPPRRQLRVLWLQETFYGKRLELTDELVTRRSGRCPFVSRCHPTVCKTCGNAFTG